MEDQNFRLVYQGYIPEEESRRETLCTLGNGYFATRGARESSSANAVHYPGTYLAGGYNRLETDVAGQIVENEDLVNWPNWLVLTFRIGNGEWFSVDRVRITSYVQTLDMMRGVLDHSMRFTDNDGHETTLVSSRIVHMKNPHLAAIRWRITPENWSGAITLHSALDGTVTNSGVARYRALSANHFERLSAECVSEDGIVLEVRTSQSRIHMAQAARTRVFERENLLPVHRKTIRREGYIAQDLSFSCRQGHPVRIEKIAALFTSRDHAISEPSLAAVENIAAAGSFDELLTTHERAWKDLWDRFDIVVCCNDTTQFLSRLHIFHILQTASPHTFDLDVGIPPRGLHGEAYRGHILWDELFTFPFLNLRDPLLTRGFLLYRYRRLDKARMAAHQAGYRGALFPWQSGSDGREESQKIHLNPRSGRWVPDETYLQRHVNAAIIYNIWQYFQATDDREFLSNFGAEIIIEVAKFWSSLARFNPQRQRFEIHGVVGPDEYHTRYPGANTPGINNNAYTNIMAAWVLTRAGDVLTILDESRKREILRDLEVDDEEIDRWDRISRTLYVPFANGIIEQFEGYAQLKELDWERYRQKYGENMRLDRVIESENDSVNAYKASKQADVLMLFYLFSAEKLQLIFERLGCQFDRQSIPETINYYLSRTSNGSTLSRVVSSWVLSRSDRKRSWHDFEKALISDFKDVQGGTTSEGIHLGAMAGTVDLVQRCYMGIEIRGDVLHLNPRIPENLREVRQRIRYRGHWIGMTVSRTGLTISFEKGWGAPIKIRFHNELFEFSEPAVKTFKLENGE
jgi:trehalose/maltose hydrolase-like predicted phosphorylase